MVHSEDMDFLILTIVFAVTAIALGISIYLVMIRMFKTESIQVFIFALLMLFISEFMVIFLFTLSLLKLTGAL